MHLAKSCGETMAGWRAARTASCRPGLFVAVILLALPSHSSLAEDMQGTPTRMAYNFLEEALEEGGIRIPDEGLGFSGSRQLRLGEKTAANYAQFVRRLGEASNLQVLNDEAMSECGTYKALLLIHPSTGPEPTRALAKDILYLGSRLQQASGLDLSRPQTAAIVAFASFNGAGGVVFGAENARLLGLTAPEASALAKDLKVSYLISVELVPWITHFDPMGADLGTVGVWHRVRIYNAEGEVVFDETNPGNAPASSAMRFVGLKLSFSTRLGMGTAKTVFMFPTDEQEAALVATENSLMLETMAEELQGMEQRMLGRRPN